MLLPFGRLSLFFINLAYMRCYHKHNGCILLLSVAYYQLFVSANFILAEIQYSMKAPQRKNTAISDIRITFRPKSITFNRPTTANYRIYLQKNVQIINQVNQVIRVSPKNTTHNFAHDLTLKPFRVASKKTGNYQLSLYEVQQSGNELQYDSCEFSLSKFIHHYYKELQAIEEQLRGKQKSAVAESWRVLSNNFTRRIFSSAAKFTNADAVLEFSCVPETDYDELVREDDILQEKKREFQAKSKKQSQFAKARTLPAVDVKPQNAAKRYHENDSDSVTLFKAKELDEKAKREMTESLKNFHIRIPTNKFHTPDTTGSTNSNQVTSGVDRSSSLNQPTGNQDIYLIQEEEQMNEGSGKNGERRVAEIFVKNHKGLEIPENTGLSMKMGNLSLNSIMTTTEKQKQKKPQQKSSTKEILITTAWMTLYASIIIFLMHPISKVQ